LSIDTRIVAAQELAVDEQALDVVAPGRAAPAPFPKLEDFVAAARDRSPAAVEARARLAQREVEREESVLALLPGLTTTASYTRNQQEVGIPIQTSTGALETVVTQPLNQLDLRVRLEATLLDVSAFHRVGHSDLSVDVAALEANVVGEDLERQVVSAYWERIAADAVVGAAEVALTTARANVDVVVLRRDSELATDLDVERARAAFLGAERTRADAMRSQAKASRRLRTLTGLDVSAPAPRLDADLAALPPAPGDTEPLVPSVLLARKNLEVADATTTSEWLALVPRITASAEERITNAAGFGPSPAYTLGLSAEWRLSPATFGRSRSAAARAEVLRATAAKSATDAEGALADAWFDVLYRWESAKAARAEAQAAAAALESARRLYVASKVTQIEVVTAARDALQAEVDRIQADANLELARALYALARGERQERSR
jgi:outer membrane protein TolC